MSHSTMALPATVEPKAASGAEAKFAQEVLDCAAYYQISSEALFAMKAEQMRGVAERLKKSSEATFKIAKQYDQAAEEHLQEARKRQIAKMKDSSGLRALMTEYRSKCQQILVNPENRLNYWQMVEM
ncbi:MAG: hypothetical protein ACPGUD_08750 [Parashewanella sp.]